MNRVTLRSRRGAGGVRHLGAWLTAAGDLVVEGHDLGSGVEAFFGEGRTEYEWTWTIRAADIPLLSAALEGRPDEGILALLRRTCSNENASRLDALLGDGKAVPAERWSRVGG
jgi:hypothetical protein